MGVFLITEMLHYFIPGVVFGYIDPGTGSIILQAVVGAIAGIAIAVKLFWYRILKIFGIRKKSALDEEEE